MLEVLEYNGYDWEAFDNIKILLYYMQGAFNKFLCMYYNERDWSHGKELFLGKNNVNLELLVDPLKVVVPPLYIKLALIKKFVSIFKLYSISFLRQRSQPVSSPEPKKIK